MLSYRLRHRITFQEPIIDQDDSGAEVVRWQVPNMGSRLLHNIPAEVLTGAGRELIVANTKQAEIAARINLRWFPGLRETWRILWDDKIYNIESISTDITGRVEYRLQCSGGLTDGR